MEPSELYNLYNEGKISQADLQSLFLLLDDVKLSDDEAIKKENTYFEKFEDVLETISSDEEQARILFEITTIYTDICTNCDNVDSKTKATFSTLYSMVKIEQEHLHDVCENVKRYLAYAALKYKRKTAFVRTNKVVFNEILNEKTIGPNRKNNLENRSADR